MKRYFVLLGFILCFTGCDQNKESKNETGLQGKKSNYQTSYFTTSDGVKLRYLTTGNGPVIIFQPGFMMPAEVFEPQLNLLSKSFRVIALDPRGQGLSEDSPNDNYVTRRAKDIFELIENEQIDSCILAGWSLGALDVLSFIENFGSKKLIGLVLIDGPISTDDEGLQAYFKSDLHKLQTKRKEHDESFISWVFYNVQDTVLMNTIKERVRNTPTNSSFVAIGTHILEPRDYSQVLENADVPVLVTLAQFTDQLEKYKKVKGNIAIENFRSHDLFLDEAERFNKLISEFYERSRMKDNENPK